MPKEKRSVVLATNEELFDLSYRLGLKVAVINRGIGQRDWPTEIQHALLRADIEGVEIRYENGDLFEIPLIDCVWKNERYIRIFLASTRCEHPERDALIDLYFKLLDVLDQ